MNNNLETIRIFSEDVIPVYDTDTGEKVVLGRELHERLKIKTAYKDWFPRMCEYGFVEGTDYSLVAQKCATNNPKNPYTTRTEHVITLDMAKHIAMIQRTPQGMEIRQKLIDLEFLSTPSARRATAKTETKSLFSNKLYNILHEFRRALIYNGSKNDPNHAK